MQFLSIYMWPEFKTAYEEHVVNAYITVTYIYFYIFHKNMQNSIAANSHLLLAYNSAAVPRTPVMSGHLIYVILTKLYTRCNNRLIIPLNNSVSEEYF